jgi:predicted Ser/Thr protein kinase
MTTPRRCPQCQTELPVDAPDGVCPKCLMQQGFESTAAAPAGDSAADPRTDHSGFVAPSPAELAPHFPQFEIVELLGKGGMGAVYKARQPNLDRFVALKILPPEVGKDPAFAERFMREARALAMLNHPGIVAVYDFGETDGLYYFAMEYVDGTNLRQTIATGGLNPSEALAIVPQICDALQFAHDEGVVHRDIKPENILIDKRGRVKIADFGLAKLLGAETEDSPARRPFTLTATHQVMGTQHYMAPEQMQGSSAIDHRADIYSLGVVFYEMLTGELPIGRFEAPSTKVQIDVRLDEVVLRSLESVPNRRYQHISDVKTEVESIVHDNSPRMSPEKPDGSEFQSWVRGQLKIPAIGLLIAGIINLLATPVILLLPILIDGSDGFLAGLKEGFVQGSRTVTEDMFLAVIVASLSFASGITLVLGAARMLDLQSYGVALFAALAGIVPCALAFPISLPFGIWALIIVLRHDVRTTFADETAESKLAALMQQPGSVVGVMMIFGLITGVLLGTIFGNIGLCVGVGMVVGILVGQIIDMNNRRKAKHETK